MQTIVIVVHIMITIALVVVVLLQRSEGGALGMGGSGAGVGGFMSARGAANVLTRATAFLAAAFFATSITLAVIGRSGSEPSSILDGTADSLELPVPAQDSEPQGLNLPSDDPIPQPEN